MKTRKVFLNELTPASDNYKVRVKVIEKGRPQTGQVRKLPFPGLLLVDEKGNKMRGALFGEQLQHFRDAIVYNGTYEIANDTIKPMEDRWKKGAGELNYQMGFAKRTVIQPLNTEGGTILPEYIAIGQIPKMGDPAEKFNLLGVVLFVENPPRQAKVGPTRTVSVTEIFLLDHSTQQPLAISAWGDLAATAFAALSSKNEELSIAGLTALKVSQHKGFSMSTTMSSEIIQDPTGDKATCMTNWVSNNTQKLMDIKSRIAQAKLLSDQKTMITISALRAKTAKNTLQDERYWLRVKIPSPEFESLNAYLGCSNCGRRSEMPLETIYNCPICNKDGCNSTPRTVFSCEVNDGTGTLPITAFTNNTEKIFSLTTQDIFRMKVSEDLSTFESAKRLITTTEYLIEVSPKTSLNLSNILEWVLRQVIVEGHGSEDCQDVIVNQDQGNKQTVLDLPKTNDKVEATTSNTNVELSGVKRISGNKRIQKEPVHSGKSA